MRRIFAAWQVYTKQVKAYRNRKEADYFKQRLEECEKYLTDVKGDT